MPGLVIFPGALGDLVLFLPALAELARRSDEPPILWCRGDLAALVHATGLARPEPIEGRGSGWLFSAEPPEEARAFFSACDWIRSFTGAADPTVRANLAAWKGERASAHPFRPPRPMHLAVHFLREIGVEVTEPPEPGLSLRLPPREQSQAVALNRRPRLVVHPGSGGHQKRWSRRGFLEVARRWENERGSVGIVIGPAESSEGPTWRAAGFTVLDALDPLELAELFRHADRYLGNDSGPSHLAALAGAAGVALFGPTRPEEWRPLSRRLVAISLAPWTPVEDDAPAHAIALVERALASGELP